MKLIQLNAWAGRLETQIERFLAQELPDILCLQEIISTGGKDTGFFFTAENAQQATALPNLAMAPTLSFNYQKTTAQYGNAVLSRYPITKTEAVFTHLEHVPDFEYGADSSNVRNFVHATLSIDGQPCHVITHHGFHVDKHKNGTPETLKHMQQLAAYIQNLSGPVILTGDFNLAPHSASIGVLNALLCNLSVENRLETTRTSLTHKTGVCDYIFVNGHVKVAKP